MATETAGEETGETERLCRFLASAGAGDVPEPALDHAKRMVLDTVGVTLAAVDADAPSVVRETKAATYRAGGDGPRVLGTGLTGSAPDVAFLNGVMSHALDFDDVHHAMGGHPSSPVLSALLPVAERTRASGERFLAAFVLGCEVEVTLANVLNPGHYERGWHPTAVLGTLGAAAGVGVLLDLDAEELRRALGIAASGTGGVKANFGTMTKPYHVGHAARDGVEAAELAAEGFTASRTVLEEPFGGFCDLFQGDPPHDFDDHLEALGSPWKVLDPPVGFKPYPCCGSTHAAVDAALALHDDGDFDPGEVERVTIGEHPRRLDHTDRPTPTDDLEAKFSVQYCVTVALHRGDLWLDHFEASAVTDPTYRAFLDRVETRPDRERFDDREWAAEVTVTTTDGSEYATLVPAPRGSSENPLSRDELAEKYRRCVAPALPADATERSRSIIERLETVDDVGTLVDALTP
ncbi:MAG: MmgE/PrpD family protein [Haloferacaceae archaeon]